MRGERKLRERTGTLSFSARRARRAYARPKDRAPPTRASPATTAMADQPCKPQVRQNTRSLSYPTRQIGRARALFFNLAPASSLFTQQATAAPPPPPPPPTTTRPPPGDFGALLMSTTTNHDNKNDSHDNSHHPTPSPSPSPPPRPAVVGPDLRRGSPTRGARGSLTSDQAREMVRGVDGELRAERGGDGGSGGPAQPGKEGGEPQPPPLHAFATLHVFDGGVALDSGCVSLSDPAAAAAVHLPAKPGASPPSDRATTSDATPAALHSPPRPPSPSASSVGPREEEEEEDEEEGAGERAGGAATTTRSNSSGGAATSTPATTAPAARPPPPPPTPRSPAGRHFIIATLAGKPVWSSEDGLAGTAQRPSLAGTAAVAGALADFAADARGDALASFTVGGGPGASSAAFSSSCTTLTRVALIRRGSLRLTAASAWDEPEPVLVAYCDALHAQVLALLTSGLHRAVRRDAGLDAARLLAGAEPTLAALVDGLDGPDAAVVCGAFPPLPLPAGLRQCAAAALATAVAAGGAVGGGLLLVGDLVAALAGGGVKGGGGGPGASTASTSWSPADVLALIHFVRGSPSLRRPGVEACAPVCLPARDPARLWHAYVAPCPEEEEEEGGEGGGRRPGTHAPPASPSAATTLILLGDRASAFPALARAGRAAVGELRRGGVLAAAGAAARAPGGGRVSVADLPPALLHPRPLHFALRSVTRGQVVASGVDPADPAAPALPPPGAYARARAALSGGRGLGCGVVVLGSEEDSGGGGGGGGGALPPPPTPRLRTHWTRRGALAVLGLAGPEYEVYLTFAGGADPGGAAAVGAGLTAWVRGRAGEVFVGGGGQ